MKSIKKSPRTLPANKVIIKKIGSRIKKLRQKAGFSSMEKFAYEHSISRTQYARYERGEDMRLSSLLNIVSLHNLTIQEFVEAI